MDNMLVTLWMSIRSTIREENGQDLVEYALIIALLALALVGGLNTLAGAMGTAFTNIGNQL